MQCIGDKIHTPLRVFESFGEHDRALHREARQSREGAQGRRDLRSGKAVYAAQHPFAFEQNRRADEDITRIDRGPRPGSIGSGGKQRHAPWRAHRDDSEQVRSDRYSQFTWPVRQISAHLRSHQHPTPTARSVALDVAAAAGAPLRHTHAPKRSAWKPGASPEPAPGRSTSPRFTHRLVARRPSRRGRSDWRRGAFAGARDVRGREETGGFQRSATYAHARAVLRGD